MQATNDGRWRLSFWRARGAAKGQRACVVSIGREAGKNGKETETMKRFVLAAIFAAMIVGPVWAQEEPQEQPQQQRRRGRRRRARAGRRGPSGTDLMERMKKELELSGEQVDSIQQIWDTHQETMRNWWTENQAAFDEQRDQIRKAWEAGDRDAVREAAGKMRELFSQRPLWQELRKQVEEVLTEEQKAKAREIFQRAGGRGRQADPQAILQAIKTLSLTAEQQAKANEIVKAAYAKVGEVKDPREKRRKTNEALNAAVAKIKKEVLTEAQLTKLAELERRLARRAGRSTMADRLRGLKLTAEQQEKVDAILKEAEAKAAKAETPQARWQARREANSKILEEVLTEEQQEDYRRQFQRRRGGSRRRRPEAQDQAE